MDVVNQLNEEELEKVSEMLRVSEAMDKGDENEDGQNNRMDRMDDFTEKLWEADGDTEVEANDHVSDMQDIAVPFKKVTVQLPED